MHFTTRDFSVVDTTFISRNCILDVDISVGAPAAFQHHESIVDDIAQASDTVIVDAIRSVDVATDEEIQDRQELTKERNESDADARSCWKKKAENC